MDRLQKLFREQLVLDLMKQLNYKNPMQVPKVEKIVINMGVTGGAQDAKLVDDAAAELGLFTGQRPIITYAKKSISNFKIRAGVKLGCKVTLRGKIMYEFMDRLFNIVIPRIRDFRGVSTKAFDGRGNYTLGIKEQNIFPEIDLDKIKRVQGMDICFITTAKSDNEARELLQALGMPFVK